MSSITDKKINLIKIPLKDIQEATNNFADTNLMRQGRRTKIYVGQLLRSEKLVDIVALRLGYESMWRGRTEFMKEITTLSSLNPQYVASIVGFCDEDKELIIVTKFETNGSLDYYLSDPVTLPWTKRLEISLGIAEALSYIHYDEARKFSVIHGNVKSSKILLDEKWEPKLYGFELSSMQPAARRELPVTDTNRNGTYAYADPSYAKWGEISHKSDVYSLGVVLFELLCGRKAFVEHDDGGVVKIGCHSFGAVNKPWSVFSTAKMAPTFSRPQMMMPLRRTGTNLSRPSLPSSHVVIGTSSNISSSSSHVVRGTRSNLIAPSISDIVRGTRSNLSSSSNLSLEEKYMMTMKNLEQLRIPEDGLLAKLAISHYDDENKTLDDIIPPTLRNQMNDESLNKFSEVAYWCLKKQQAQRPNIQRVIVALEQALDLQLAQDRSTAEDTITNYLKGKDWDDMKIGLDAIESANKRSIAEGTFGSVYVAELDSSVIPMYKADSQKRSIPVALKYIKNQEGEQGFLAEIEILRICKHPNVVCLLGFCYEAPKMILVYEHIANGSLEGYLGREAKMTNLTWVERLNICIDVARGLNYIHSMENKNKIIHRDIKSANILLGKNLEAKVADFGLSIFQPLNQSWSTINTTDIAGTHTYLDPEYDDLGKLKKESDVYSFGVVLFEILTGRFACEWVTKNNKWGLAPVIREQFDKKGTLKEMVDPKLKEQADDFDGFTLNRGLNEDSLRTFSEIGYKCVSEKQKDRPTMEVVIAELQKALEFQKTHKDPLRMSHEDIKRVRQNFGSEKRIANTRSGILRRGVILVDKESTQVVVKGFKLNSEQRHQEFLTELEILSQFKHENIISLIGYSIELGRDLVFEYASNESLDRHLRNASLTWTKRLKIAIDVAMGLDFLHVGGSTQVVVIHFDIKSTNILLTKDWKAKIADFRLSKITAIDAEVDFMVGDVCGTEGYVDPQCRIKRSFTRESDVYSLGVVLFEIMSGRTASLDLHEDLVELVKQYYEDEKLHELVFEDIKNTVVPKSLSAYQSIAYECLHYEREQRPTASKVVSMLKEALGFQEDIEIWMAKRPRDYKEIIQMSTNPKTYYSLNNKKLCEKLYRGILLNKDKVYLSINSNKERNETVSATMFSYENNRLQNKRIFVQNSSFQKVVKVMDISSLNIQIKIKTLFLSPNVNYGAHLVFKFCDPKAFSSKKQMYVNLKYRMGSETLHAYFATRGDKEWMMIELCRFIPNKKDVEFEVLLESLSRYYCQSDAIYVEGIQFRASNIDAANLKVPEVDEKLKVEDGEKLSKTKDKKCHMLPAKIVLYETSDVINRFNWKSLHESRFEEAAELLSHQVFQIKCKIETQKLSPETHYACYLVFKLSQQCHGLHCPVKVRDVLLRKNKEFKFLYFRSPRDVNVHGNERVPDLREDGLMEVIVWEFNSSNMRDEDRIPMSLKLRCYEGTMSGLVVYGIEFRPI